MDEIKDINSLVNAIMESVDGCDCEDHRNCLKNTLSQVDIRFKDVSLAKTEPKGCGLKIIVEGNNSRFCGEEFWGKRRYCAKCQELANSVPKGCGKSIEYRKNDEVVVESKCGFLEGDEIKLCPECQKSAKNEPQDKQAKIKHEFDKDYEK